MKITESSLIEQIALRLYSYNDPDAAAEYIFSCMNSSWQSPDDINSTQAFFLEATKALSQIDKDYSLECSRAYLKIVKEQYGAPASISNTIEQGEKDE